MASSALLVIDTQVDFVDGGACPVPGTTQVLPAITRLLRAYRAADHACGSTLRRRRCRPAVPHQQGSPSRHRP
ncbi:isochorismatase family protein [Frankia sp. Cas4]|uniref:isochorismatase family protein n=1 Tax=Frankia sp. Cas4 TaxID=3073927 RepID=UPI003A100F38